VRLKRNIEKTAELEEDNFQSRLPVLQSQAASSAGKVRTHNEDALFTMSTQVYLQAQRQALGLYMLADGMGGHVDGERASSLAVQTASQVLLRRFLEPITPDVMQPSDEGVNALLDQAMQAAQAAVLASVPGGGSTLTVALVLGRQLYFAHVGDTRLYFYPQSSQVQVLTKDHSVARRLVDLGQLNAAEAQVTPLRNRLFRALGQGEGFAADFGWVALEKPTRLLLCSDGLWSTLPEAQLLEALQQEPMPADAAWKLVQSANAAGGSDNISIILVNIF